MKPSDDSTMANAPSAANLDKWRNYFKHSKSDIFNIIKNAIMVAAYDRPSDFKLKRDRIAEILFTCKITTLLGCDNIGTVGKNDDKNMSRNDNDQREDTDINMNEISHYNYEDVEALADEIEEESQFLGEVLRIKRTIENSDEMSDELLLDSLTGLRLMPLSVEILKATEIGKSVATLQKQRSKEIQNLVRMLIKNWKIMIDEWFDATEAIIGAQVTKESSTKPSLDIVEEEEGLPCPPLDEGAFFLTPTPMDLAQFFDGLDDDGNPPDNGEFNKDGENGIKFESANNDPSTPLNDLNAKKKTKEEFMLKKLSKREYGIKRPKPAVQQKFEKGTIQKKPISHQQEFNYGNEDSMRMKLELAKRKLHQRYQEVESAKRQKTTQFVELRDLPKPSYQQMRPCKKHKQWAYGRRRERDSVITKSICKIF